MIEKLQNKINEDMLKFSKEKQDAINNSNWIRVIEDTGKKFLLLDNEVTSLQSETWLVLMGVVDLDLYERNIENNVGMTNDDAKKISEEVLNKIFVPVSNEIESYIKDKKVAQNSSWDKTIKFIISGGDYSSFIEK